jgi:hypothetical protein
LEFDGTIAELRYNGTNPVFDIADIPSGAVSVLVSDGNELTCTYGGGVYQRSTSGTLNCAPLYMYLTSRVEEDTSTGASAYDRWTDNTDFNLYGNKLSTPQAALDENGILEFSNTALLTTGRYRLTIDSGCIGRVDDDFDGFSVALTVDTLQLDVRLQTGKDGADFRGLDTFEFDYTGTVTGNWLLTVQYLNELTDVNRGTARNMVIYGYKLERITTEVYKIELAGAGSSPLVTQVPITSDLNTVPGGWLAILNSYGTVVRLVHESQVYPENDTVKSNVPLSSVLTSNTWMRREDHPTFTSGQTVLPDAPAAGMPTFGSLIVR